MPTNAERTFQEALALPSSDRAALVESLLSSLDRPDPTIDELWVKEAGDRLAAFNEGRMSAIPAEDVFAEFDQGPFIRD